MDRIDCEIRFEEDATRETPGRLRGVLMTYGEKAKDRPELFTAGALHWPDTGIRLYEQHNRQAPIMRFQPFLVGSELRVDAPIPNTSRGRDAAIMVADGTLGGLSVEFYARRQTYRNGLRVIEDAELRAAGLVDSPSYGGSTVEVRAAMLEDLELLLWL